jgi:hypothetical protein
MTDRQIDKLPELASDLVRRQVAVLVTAGDAGAVAANHTPRSPSSTVQRLSPKPIACEPGLETLNPGSPGTVCSRPGAGGWGSEHKNSHSNRPCMFDDRILAVHSASSAANRLPPKGRGI